MDGSNANLYPKGWTLSGKTACAPDTFNAAEAQIAFDECSALHMDDPEKALATKYGCESTLMCTKGVDCEDSNIPDIPNPDPTTPGTGDLDPWHFIPKQQMSMVSCSSLNVDCC